MSIGGSATQVIWRPYPNPTTGEVLLANRAAGSARPSEICKGVPPRRASLVARAIGAALLLTGFMTTSAIAPPPAAATVPEKGQSQKTGAVSATPEPAPEQRRSIASPWGKLTPLGEQVASAIDRGVQALKTQQRDDGSWTDIELEARTGMTSLVTLALLSARERPDSPPISKALALLRRFGPAELRNTYAIALQTLVFTEAEPAQDRERITANVSWLENAQFNPRDNVGPAGTWTYSDMKRRPGDNSNTQWAFLALHAASESGVPVKPEVWALARAYWEKCQKPDGSWGYTPDSTNQTASMTCAGISSSIIAALHSPSNVEVIRGAAVSNCGSTVGNRSVQAGIDWLAKNFYVNQNFRGGQQWRFYYMWGLERVGRLSGVRYFGERDWYRDGATELVRIQITQNGFWKGALVEDDRVLATSYAVLFLAKGRAPVLINKLRHDPGNDWDNDPNDVRNLVAVIARERKTLLVSRIVDPGTAPASDLLQAPIAFFNGHRAPEFNAPAKEKLRQYVEKGGYMIADACCASADFDRGFRALMRELFREEQFQLRPLPDDHPVWRARHLILPKDHPLWGIEFAGRTAVIYSPQDLSCYWNQSERIPDDATVQGAIKLGQNLIEYAVGPELPPDKLWVP